MSSHDIVTLSAVASHVASSHKYEVQGDSWGMPITQCAQACSPAKSLARNVTFLTVMARMLRGDDDVAEDRQRYGFQPSMEDSTLGRMHEASAFLQPLNSILAEANMALLLKPSATQGDGYCFFYVAASVCGMDVSQTAARQSSLVLLKLPVR